jgi:hypothetical protein
VATDDVDSIISSVDLTFKIRRLLSLSLLFLVNDVMAAAERNDEKA